MRLHGQRSCLALPLVARDRLIGVVDLLDHVEREFTDEEIAIAEAVGQLVALASSAPSSTTRSSACTSATCAP